MLKRVHAQTLNGIMAMLDKLGFVQPFDWGNRVYYRPREWQRSRECYQRIFQENMVAKATAFLLFRPGEISDFKPGWY